MSNLRFISTILVLATGLSACVPFFQSQPDSDSQPVYGPSNDMLKVADIKNGEKLSVGCTACHSIFKGQAPIVGPNLYRIVGARIARQPNYDYSDGLRRFKDEHWTIDTLDQWLKSPSSMVPGTKMVFGGLLDPQDRMDLIAYLMSIK